MPPRFLRPPGLLLAVLLAAAWALAAPAQAPKTKTYLFCFWNVENFFDDKPNPKLEKVDREFDDYFAKDAEALAAKLDRLCQVLLGKEMNNGQGPDILALAEVESQRAAELLREALNKRIKEKELHYKTVVYRDPQGGRSIATAVLTRVPVQGTPRLVGRFQRILVVPLAEDKHALTVVASHWTSRVSDKTGRGRSSYARQIYDDFFAAHRRDPAVDYLVCGDFNDTPTDDSLVNDLGSTGDLDRVLALKKDEKPMFYNPFAPLAAAGKGTHYFGGRAYVFDHVCLSPGLLDGEGWSYVNKSAAVVERLQFRGRPDRFGGPADRRPFRNRGASDHYPVTVQLRVAR
ncbi:MAG: endonuclease/exonuclease/phosphatase family protein [Gemmataceae bacterium]